MELRTYQVRWNEKGSDISFGNRETRVFTSSEKKAVEHIKRNYQNVFKEIISVIKEEKKATVCECCGQITHKNYI